MSLQASGAVVAVGGAGARAAARAAEATWAGARSGLRMRGVLAVAGGAAAVKGRRLLRARPRLHRWRASSSKAIGARPPDDLACSWFKTKPHKWQSAGAANHSCVSVQVQRFLRFFRLRHYESKLLINTCWKIIAHTFCGVG